MNHTIERWGVTFLEHLDRATRLCEGMNYVQVGWGSNVKLMGLRSDFTHLDEEAVTAAYRRAERRVLLLDYDGWNKGTRTDANFALWSRLFAADMLNRFV